MGVCLHPFSCRRLPTVNLPLLPRWPRLGLLLCLVRSLEHTYTQRVNSYNTGDTQSRSSAFCSCASASSSYHFANNQVKLLSSKYSLFGCKILHQLRFSVANFSQILSNTNIYRHHVWWWKENN